MKAILITLVSAALARFALRAEAQEWTRFRGPNGTGVSHAQTVPARITDADINWKVELPGTGHSSPVLWSDHIFLTSTGDKSGGISVLCLTAEDGKLTPRRDLPLTPFARPPFHSFAPPTPSLAAHRL